MDDKDILTIEKHEESWFGTLFRWCPTSLDLLRESEKKILENLKTSYNTRYINVGSKVGNESNFIWTFFANESSSKTPVILIHGFAAGLGFWCLNIDSFAANRPVYAFDILGFGRSSRPNFTPDAVETEKEFVSTIENWRSVLGLERFILLGHSFGGFLATSYAIKYPERVSHLILADPWGFPERPLDVAERYNLPLWVKLLAMIIQPFNPLFAIRTAGPFGPRLIKTIRPDIARKFKNLIPNAKEAMSDYLYHCNAQCPSGESAFHSMMSGFGWAKYPMIHRMTSLDKNVPITLIYGARSWVDRDPGFQIKYMRKHSYVDVQIIQGAGHHVYADRAQQFNSIVNKIGTYCDTGSLPTLSDYAHASANGIESFSKIVNVGKEDYSKDYENETESTE